MGGGNRERLGEEALLNPHVLHLQVTDGLVLRRALLVAQEEHATALLRHAIVGSIDHPPFHGITEIRQGSQHDGEIPAALSGWTLQETIDVFEEQVSRRLVALLPEDALNLPPQDAFSATKAFAVAQGRRHTVVLAGEASHEQVVIWNRLGRDSGDVVTTVMLRTPTGLVDLIGMLALRAGLPLIGPDHAISPVALTQRLRVPAARGHAIPPLKPKAESADSSEELHHAQRVVLRVEIG